ncbi:alpha-galactosidase [Actinoplanes sp. SE50]|uniref:alpha-galactosidase n=1 Tax=unclassified Actinoplanes TaxID=2626549 RepID=UPI00023EC6CA|nr:MULTISPECIES: alpha-galactosidase [unclassified Actinoplanes]AEV87605.1 glycoside hydrolase clan GH-D [Actinoplanes sp. SE50/110]ATO86008.1 alpha-galactosidase [Actinoplanes sp. SE50]SLM03422.1 alpha-galactosidase [Actinoplanes sp. SE50/110]
MTFTHLRAAGVSFVLNARGAVLYWGADLGELPDGFAASRIPAIPPSSIDVPLQLSLLPSIEDGWTGRPAFPGHRTRITAVQHGQNTITVRAEQAGKGLELTTECELTPEGVLRLRHRVDNHGLAVVDLAALNVLLPIPPEATELIDFSGLWAHERRPQRAPLRDGVWSRESRHGRPGHDDAFLLMAATPGAGFRTGRVWAVHLAWSGDKQIWAERSPLGQSVLGAGELLSPGEIRLAPGDSYTTPWLIAVYSENGFDGLSDRLHPWIRASRRTAKPRPVVLNTWEAVYFDQSLDRLTALVDAAAESGVERFVLDDGWFTGRRDDRRALGDWHVDPVIWPDGLHPLIARVEAAGMDFGLWVEPEMVSPDSVLARAHPEWILGPPDALTWRFQRVLDLAVPAAYAHVLGRLTDLLTEYPIAFLKWDHNRDLLEPGAAHRQTTALYRLLAELRAAFPELEIESCASGGARIDLGILPHVDRFWTSDTNDPLDRQLIQRWTSVLIPPEMLGGHLGDGVAHVTGRTSALGLRMATALFGHAGIEWDLSRAAPADRALIAAWTAEYKRLRGLLHTGVVVRADHPDPAVLLHGVVAPDRSAAVFALVTLGNPVAALPPPIRFPGLDPDRSYTVRPLGHPPRMVQDAPPPWLAEGAVTLTGRVLAEAGLPAPLLVPEQAALFTLTAVA